MLKSRRRASSFRTVCKTFAPEIGVNKVRKIRGTEFQKRGLPRRFAPEGPALRLRRHEEPPKIGLQGQRRFSRGPSPRPSQFHMGFTIPPWSPASSATGSPRRGMRHPGRLLAVGEPPAGPSNQRPRVGLAHLDDPVLRDRDDASRDQAHARESGATSRTVSAGAPGFLRGIRGLRARMAPDVARYVVFVERLAEPRRDHAQRFAGRAQALDLRPLGVMAHDATRPRVRERPGCRAREGAKTTARSSCGSRQPSARKSEEERNAARQ